MRKNIKNAFIENKEPEVILEKLISEGFKGQKLLKEFLKLRGYNYIEEIAEELLIAETISDGWNNPLEDNEWDHLLND